MSKFTCTPFLRTVDVFIQSTEGMAPKSKTFVFLSFKTLVRVVRLTVIIMLCALLQVSARTTAQTRISLSLKGVTLEKVFAEIEKRSGYTVFYNVEVLKAAGANLLSLDVKDATIEDVMFKCLKGLPLQFTIQEKTIFVKKEAPRAELISPPGPGGPSPETFGGVVKAESGAPLAGATVYVVKLKQSAVTDKDGQFVMKNIPDGEYEVEITFIGYEPRKLKVSVVNHAAWLPAELKLANSNLDETVVKGYYSTTNRLNTGDVTTVKADIIQAQPVSDPIQALEGRVPGLYIQQTSGIAGAYATIQIRGQNSIANGNDPLYIVDGVPYSSVSLSNSSWSAGAFGFSSANFNVAGGGISPFNALNPGDIESITVLKDADATAIYGSRGANGVILITTKHGKAGVTHYDLQVYTGGGKPARTMHLLNTTQYLEMRHEAYANDGISTIAAGDYDLNGVWDTTRSTNWQKALIGHVASFTNVQGSVTGGNTNTQFLIGGGYNNQGTVFPGNYQDQKASAHFSLTHFGSDRRFHLQLGANYIYDDNGVPAADLTGLIPQLAPDAPALYDQDGNINWQILNGRSTWPNPLAYTLTHYKSSTNNLISNLNLGYRILPGLELKSAFGYNRAEMNQVEITPSERYPPPNSSNPLNRSSFTSINNSTTWIIEPQLDFQRAIGHGKIAVLLGSTFQQLSSSSLGEDAYGFSSDALITDPLAAAHQRLLGVNNTFYRYEAIYGGANYNWSDKYLVNLTARRDGSSRFGPGKQFGNFGAAGIGWIFSKEGFIQDHLSFLSFGKLHGSYGITGNDQIRDYQYLSTYSPNSPSYQGVSTLSPTHLTNPYFAWEVVKKLEGGIDLGFIHDRILAGINVYRNRTGNQLVGYPLPILTGFNSVQYNLPAIVQNRGIEITLSTVNVKTKDFNWTSAANFSIPSNKLVAFPGLANSDYSQTYVVGKSLFIKEVYHFNGINPQTGVYSFATKNANGVPSFPQDAVISKPVTQKYYGGLNNKFTYKGFELDVFFQYVNQLGYNYKEYFGSPGTVEQNQPTAVLSRWRSTGDVTSVQRFGTTATTYNPYFILPSSDGVITDASFLRLKNLAIYYQVPAGWTNRMRLQGLRLYVLCQNLLTVTRYLGFDPESRGLNLPPLRMITGGLNVNF